MNKLLEMGSFFLRIPQLYTPGCIRWSSCGRLRASYLRLVRFGPKLEHPQKLSTRLGWDHGSQSRDKNFFFCDIKDLWNCSHSQHGLPSVYIVLLYRCSILFRGGWMENVKKTKVNTENLSVIECFAYSVVNVSWQNRLCSLKYQGKVHEGITYEYTPNVSPRCSQHSTSIYVKRRPLVQHKIECGYNGNRLSDHDYPSLDFRA